MANFAAVSRDITGLQTSHAGSWFRPGLLLLAALAVGCGSGGGPTTPGTGKTLTLTVTLPSGSALSGAALTLDSALSSSALSGNSGQISVTGEGYALAAATAGGTPVLLGFVTTGHTALSARTAAEALLFYRLGGPYLEPAMQGALLELLSADDWVGPLVTAIEQDLRLKAPAGLSGAAVQSALAAAAKTFGAVQAQALNTQSVTVNPELQSSGLTVKETEPLKDEVKIYNAYRRPLQVYLERVSPDPLAVQNFALEAASVQLPASASRLANYLGGPTGDVPREWVASGALALPAVNDQSTTYRLTAVGAGGTPLGAGTAEQLAEAREVARRTALEKFIVPTISAALAAGGPERSASDNTLLSGVSAAHLAAIESGDFAAGVSGAFRDLFSAAKLNSTVGSVLQVYYPSLRPTARSEIAARLSRELQPLVALDSYDPRFHGVMTSIEGAKRLEVFTVTARPIKLRVTPAATTLGKGGEVFLKAEVLLPAGESSSAITYRWTLTDTGGNVPAGYLQEGGQDRPNTFTTPGTSVRYAHRDTLNLRYGTDTVTVEALRDAGTGNGPEVIAKGTASVTVKAATVTLSPRTADLEAGDTQTFTAKVDPPPTGGSLRYLFSTSGSNASTFVGGAQTLDTASGTATLRVDGDPGSKVYVKVYAFLDKNGTLSDLGEVEATVTIKDAQGLQNGDFSKKLDAWTPGGAGGRLKTEAGCVPSQTGNPYFAFDVYSNRVGTLSQTFKVPAAAKTLSFRTWNALDPVKVSLSVGGVSDAFTAPSVEVLKDPQDLYSSVCSGAAPITKSYDISGSAGKTVTLSISATAPGNNGTIVNFDDFVVR